MKQEEIAKLKLKSSYDDNLNDWVVPPFILRAKEVTLPSLKKNGYEVMEQEKESRDLTIEGDDSSEEEDQPDNRRGRSTAMKQHQTKGQQRQNNYNNEYG